MSKFDYVNAIFAYENGELDHEETVELFQYLVNTGLAWTLQGSYGRAAKALIDSGAVTRREIPLRTPTVSHE